MSRCLPETDKGTHIQRGPTAKAGIRYVIITSYHAVTNGFMKAYVILAIKLDEGATQHNRNLL